jgi:hypothetical protein
MQLRTREDGKDVRTGRGPVPPTDPLLVIGNRNAIRPPQTSLSRIARIEMPRLSRYLSVCNGVSLDAQMLAKAAA